MVHPNCVNATEIPIGSVLVFPPCEYHEICERHNPNHCLQMCAKQQYLSFFTVLLDGEFFIKMRQYSLDEGRLAETGKPAMFQVNQADNLIRIMREAKKNG